MIASNEHLSPRWFSLISGIRGASYGIAFMLSASRKSTLSSTKMNSASLSTKRRISQGQATRSTLIFFLVIHFMISLHTAHWLLSILPEQNEASLKPTLIPVQRYLYLSL